MECLNELQDSGKPVSKEQGEMYLKMLYPFAPHIASELWQKLGNQTFLSISPWPTLDTSMLVQTEFELVVQVNGKIRGRLKAQIGMTEVQAMAAAKPILAEHLVGKEIVKTIFVTNKLLNLVIR